MTTQQRNHDGNHDGNRNNESDATMTTQPQPQRKIQLADSAIYHINYTYVEYATQPSIVSHKHCYNMVALNRYAKNNATIATALQQYRGCKKSHNSFDFLDLVLDITPTIAYEIIGSIDYVDHLQLLKYTSHVADMYMTTDIKYNSKQDCFYYNLYSSMYNLLLIMVNDNPQLYNSICAQAGIIATSNRDDDTKTINDLQLPITIHTDNEQNEQHDDDDDEIIIHLYFDALCNCMECTNKRNEQHNDDLPATATATVADDTTTATATATVAVAYDVNRCHKNELDYYKMAFCVCQQCFDDRRQQDKINYPWLYTSNEQPATATATVADDYNTPTTATSNDNTKGSATMTRNDLPQFHVMTTILELQPTTQPATATVIDDTKQVFQYIYSNNGNEQKPLTSIYEYDKTQPFTTKNTTTKYFPSNKKWITTTATARVADDYNTPTTATTTATATVAEYYEKYKINTAMRKIQRATRDQKQRKQRARLQYKNMTVAEVYQKMTATRRAEKLNDAIDYDYKIDLLEYYNDGNNGNN